MDSWFQKFTYNNAEEEEIGWNVARIADTRHKYKKSLYYFSLSTKPWRRIGEWRYSSMHTITSALDGSGQLHASAALPPGKEPLVPVV
jgi:hypothetical protein